ncbi:MAG: ATP-grasp domain-containing protein [Gemmatimonadota bacterium]
MKRILFVFPTSWDRKQLEACRSGWESRYEVLYAEPSDEDCPWDLDPRAWLDEADAAWRGRIDGVTSSSDYPGATLAAALARRLELPGAPPEAVLRASHKYYSRRAQEEAVPKATPVYDLVPGSSPVERDPRTGYPCFVKPIKGAFSIMSGKVRSRAELDAFLDRPAAQEFLAEYVLVFNRLVAELTDFELDGRHFLAEEFLHGHQVTVDGWVSGGEVGILGIVDSVMHPDVPSFARFDYPSVRRPEIQETMSDVARRVVQHLGLDHTLFNVEMIYEPVSDRVCIIEINPRLCGQFADLYAKVDGTSGYEVALAVAAGDPVAVPRGRGAARMASSFPLRSFRPAIVRRAPDAAAVSAAEGLYPGTLIWMECCEGSELTDFEAEDGWSCRYAVINLGGDSRADLQARLGATVERLGIELEEL